MNNKSYLKSFFTTHWAYLAVYTACKLGVFDCLIKGKSNNALANELEVHLHSLRILLDALVSIGFLELQDEKYTNNQLSIYLTDKHADGLKYACLNWGDEHLTAMQNLDYSIRTGKSFFSSLYNSTYFEFLAKNPQKLHNYHTAMDEYARDDYESLPDLHDFGIHNTLMDVGGGYGAAINSISCKYPNLDCYLFDMNCVIQKCSLRSVKVIGGNFFDSIPILAEAIIMTRVLHDWDDEKSTQILSNCFHALPQGGSLYVVENCKDKIEQDISLLSLNMLVMCESYERKSTEYISLCKSSGFTFINEKAINQLLTLLIFKK